MSKDIKIRNIRKPDYSVELPDADESNSLQVSNGLNRLLNMFRKTKVNFSAEKTISGVTERSRLRHFKKIPTEKKYITAAKFGGLKDLTNFYNQGEENFATQGTTSNVSLAPLKHNFFAEQKETVLSKIKKKTLLSVENIQTKKYNTETCENIEKIHGNADKPADKATIRNIKKSLKFDSSCMKDRSNNIFQKGNRQISAYFESRSGHNYQPNQDSVLVDKNLFIVCDGHGQYGHLVSNFVSKQISKYITAYEQKLRINEQIFQNIFKKVAENLEEEEIDLRLSGSTAVVIKIDSQNIYCANVGDSRAIMCRGGNLIELSRDHKPNDKFEKQRILKSGGTVRQIKTNDGRAVGPYRVWNADGLMPGLAVSRGFGDLIGHQCGVINVPEVTVFSISPEDEFIILGSDGFFQFFYNEEIIKLVRRHVHKQTPEKQICKLLVDQSKKRWSNQDDTDDISCILVIL